MTLTEIYVDDDNNVTIVTVRTYVYEVVGDYNSKKEQVTLAKVDTEVGDSRYSLKVPFWIWMTMLRSRTTRTGTMSWLPVLSRTASWI